jgi:hypothetical protein
MSMLMLVPMAISMTMMPMAVPLLMFVLMAEPVPVIAMLILMTVPVLLPTIAMPRLVLVVRPLLGALAVVLESGRLTLGLAWLISRRRKSEAGGSNNSGCRKCRNTGDEFDRQPLLG